MRATLLSVLIAGLLPTVACAQAAPGPIPINAFVREDQFSAPRISPDGKRLVVQARVPVDKRTVPMLNFYSLPDMKLLGTVRMALYAVPVSYAWASNTRLVVHMGMEVGSREAPQATGEVMAVEFDGSRQKYLYGYQMMESSSMGTRYGNDYGYAFTVHVPSERNNHVYLSTQVWDSKSSALYDMDTRSAARRLVASVPTPDARFVVQNNGAPRFAKGTDKDNWYQLWRYDDSKDKWAVVDEPAGAATYPFAFTADNQHYMANWSDNDGPLKVVRAALDGSGRQVLAEDPLGSIDSFMYGSSLTTPVAALTSSGRPRVIYLEPEHRDVAIHKALSAQFADATVTFGGASDDGNKMIMTVHSDRDPGVFYLYDRATNRADELFTSMEAIDPEQMAPRRPITFKARDGMQIEGYLTMPKVAAGTRPPLVLMPHGGPHGIADTWYFNTDAQFLASRGYAVLQINYRGSSNRGRSFQVAGYRQWGGKIIDDLVDGVQWAVAQGEVDGSRMCAYGASFGAYASLMLAAREPDLFKCAIGYAGVYEPAYIFEEEGVKGNSRSEATFKRYLGTDAAELARYSPVQRAASIKAGVLLIHGGKDKIAPKEHAYKMKAALEKAGRTPEWYYVDYEGHGFYDTENQTEVYKRLEAFLGKYLR
jgi:dipeptidyl aminopeptidase/acylaminoacyl peptidase